MKWKRSLAWGDHTVVAEWKWNMWHVVMGNKKHRRMKERIEAKHCTEMKERNLTKSIRMMLCVLSCNSGHPTILWTLPWNLETSSVHLDTWTLKEKLPVQIKCMLVLTQAKCNRFLSESFVSLISNAEKQPYVAHAVHFCNNGPSLLASYLESGFMKQPKGNQHQLVL